MRGRLSWKRPARPPLWHANCFREGRQERRKLNRDPAAITSLSVACRYASRPPSVPTNPLPFKSLAPSQALSLFGRFYTFIPFPELFRLFALSPRGYKLSTRRAS